MPCKITLAFMKRQNLILPRKLFRTMLNSLAAIALGMTAGLPVRAATNATSVATNLPAWLTRPLALADCLDLALQQNGTILKAKSDLEASYGVVVQTRAIAIPKVQATGNYTDYDPSAIDRFPFGGPTFAPIEAYCDQKNTPHHADSPATGSSIAQRALKFSSRPSIGPTLFWTCSNNPKLRAMVAMSF